VGFEFRGESKAEMRQEADMHRVIVATILILFSLTAAVAGEFYVKHKGDKRRSEPTDEKALVYVFRPASVGAAIKTWTFADDQLIGLSKAKGYYFALVPAGTHVFWSKAENTSALELEVEGGETYYFKTGIRMGFGKARVKLVQISEEEANKLFDKCSYCEPTEEGRSRAAEIVANRRDKAEEKAEKRKAAGK
jgi:hypothetical protein